MTEVSATKFNRGDYSTLGPGSTIGYKTPEGQILAYVDYIENGGARVSIFTPSTGKERRYGERAVEKAAQIAFNHISRQGYTVPDFDTIEDAGNVTAEADAARAAARGQLEPAAAGQPEQTPAEEFAAYVTAAGRAPLTVDAAAAAAPQPAAALQQAAPAYGSVSEAADAVLGEPADDIVRHWISSRGTIYQLHLRAVCPPAETADALRDFIENDAHGYTRSADGRIWLWSGNAWNCGYAVVLPA